MDLQEEIAPNDLIILFLDAQPVPVQRSIYAQLAFQFLFLLVEEERDRLMVSAAAIGETKVRKLLSSKGLALVGATTSIIALIDLSFARIANAEPPAELEQELTEKLGNLDLARRFIKDSYKKWRELREASLSFEELCEFSFRATAFREPEPISVQATTQNE